MKDLPLKYEAIMVRRGFTQVVVIVALALIAIFSGSALISWKTSYLDKYLPQAVKEFLGKTQIDTNGAPTTSDVTETPTEDLTKYWKTYTTPKLGFSFKYPGDWVKDENDNTILSLNSPKGNVLSFYKDFVGGREESIRLEEKYYETSDGSSVYTTIYYGLNGDEQSVVVDGTFYPEIPEITFIYGFDLRLDESGLKTLSLILSTFKFL
jgi:hypothetical protein